MTTSTALTPQDLIDKIDEIEPIIKAGSAEAEQNSRISDKVNDAIWEIGCNLIYRPCDLGGFGFDIVSGLRIIERLSKIDSVVGWNVGASNASEIFGAWFTDETAAQVFGDPKTIFSGAFNPPRKAVAVDGGYLLTGLTPFSSNCLAATWNLGLGIIHDGDKPRLGEDGNSQTLLTIFQLKDAEIIENWDTLGMRGTGSHDLNAVDIFIPECHTAKFLPLEAPNSSYFKDPVSLMAVWTAIAQMPACALGVAQASIDEFTELVGYKIPAYTAKSLRDRSVVQLNLAKAEAKLAAGRAFYHQTYNLASQVAATGKTLTMQQKADCQQAACYTVIAAAEAVDLIHSLVGANAIRNDQNFQRYFRDIHVMTQHAFFCETRLEAVGQIRLGLEPDWPFFAF